MAGGKVVRARKANEVRYMPAAPPLLAVDIIMQHVLPGKRRSAEYGVRCLKEPFGRMRLLLGPDRKKLGRLIRTYVHLLSFRTRSIGLNQIRSFYSSPHINAATWIKSFIWEMGICAECT